MQITTKYNIGDKVCVLDTYELTILKEAIIDAILIEGNQYTTFYKINESFYEDSHITKDLGQIKLWAKHLRIKIHEKANKEVPRIVSHQGHENPFGENTKVAEPLTLSEKAQLLKTLLKVNNLPWWWELDTLN